MPPAGASVVAVPHMTAETRLPLNIKTPANMRAHAPKFDMPAEALASTTNDKPWAKAK